jgi:hypothetical protein
MAFVTFVFYQAFNLLDVRLDTRGGYSRETLESTSRVRRTSSGRTAHVPPIRLRRADAPAREHGSTRRAARPATPRIDRGGSAVSKPADVAVPSADRKRARRGLAIFCALVAVFNAVFITLLTVTGDLRWILALMWSVALSSVITRLVQREGFADVSFRLGGRRSLYWYVVGLLYA